MRTSHNICVSPIRRPTIPAPDYVAVLERLFTRNGIPADEVRAAVRTAVVDHDEVVDHDGSSGVEVVDGSSGVEVVDHDREIASVDEQIRRKQLELEEGESSLKLLLKFEQELVQQAADIVRETNSKIQKMNDDFRKQKRKRQRKSSVGDGMGLATLQEDDEDVVGERTCSDDPPLMNREPKENV